MDSAPGGPLISDHSSDLGLDEHQLESVEVDMEGVEEITPENSQPASAALYQYPSSTPIKRQIASYRHFLPLGSLNVPA